MRPFFALPGVLLMHSLSAAPNELTIESAKIAATLEPLYRQLHAQPELSNEEEKTAKILAEHLDRLGFTVTRKVGGHGVVGVFKNGSGATVLLRTDMDALPVTEQTGAAYASTVKVTDNYG